LGLNFINLHKNSSPISSLILLRNGQRF